MQHMLVAFKDDTYSRIRDLTDEEMPRIRRAIVTIHRFEVEQRFFFLAAHNHADFLRALSECERTYRETGGGMSEKAGVEMLIEVNRFLLNFLSSFRSVLDYSLHVLSLQFGRGGPGFLNRESPWPK